MKRTPKQRKRKSGFKVEWVRFPIRWIERLQPMRIGSATFKLALVILVEQFKLDQMAVKEIVLSRQVTGLSRQSQRTAIENLVNLRLIRVRREVGRADRVTRLYI